MMRGMDSYRLVANDYCAAEWDGIWGPLAT